VTSLSLEGAHASMSPLHGAGHGAYASMSPLDGAGHGAYASLRPLEMALDVLLACAARGARTGKQETLSRAGRVHKHP
jgi:hypothetical protein